MPWSTWTTRSPGVSARRLRSGSPAARLRLALLAHEAVAENVLLADDGEIGGLEARFQRPDRRPGSRSRLGQRVGEARDRLGLAQAVVLQHMGQALARAFRPGAERSRASWLPAGRGYGAISGFEHVGVLVRPLGGEVAALAAPRNR